MDIAEPSHGENEDRGRENIGRLDQTELQRRHPELAADGRQGDPDHRYFPSFPKGERGGFAYR